MHNGRCATVCLKDTHCAENEVCDAGICVEGQRSDTTAPTIRSAEPMGEGVGFDDVVVTITFSEPMDNTSGLDGVSVHKDNAGGEIIGLGSATWSDDGATLEIPVAETLLPFTRYHVILSAEGELPPIDLAGNALAASFEFEFRTVSITSPENPAVTPTNDDANGLTDYDVSFDATDGVEPGDTVTVILPPGTDLSDIAVQGDDYTIISVDGNTVTLQANTGTAPGEPVVIVLLGARNPVDNGVYQTCVATTADAVCAGQSVTLAPRDMTPPIIVTASPSESSAPISGTTLSVTFGEPMDTTTGRNAFSVHEGSLTGTSIGVLSGTWSSDATRLSTLFVTDLTPLTTYFVQVSADPALAPRDLGNNALSATYVYVFQTASDGTVTSITVMPSRPYAGSTSSYTVGFVATDGLTAGDSVTVEFAPGTDASGASGGGDGLSVVAADATTVTLSATGDASAGSVLSFTLDGIVNPMTSGASAETFYLSITTTANTAPASAAYVINPPDSVAPAISSSLPTGGDVAANGARLTVTFAEAMDTTTGQNSIVLHEGSLAGPTVATSPATWSPDGRTLTAQVSATLKSYTTYVVEVSNSVGVAPRDLAGNPIASRYTYSFRSVSTTSAAVSSLLVGDGYSGAQSSYTLTMTATNGLAAGDSITLTFPAGTSLASATVLGSNFTIVGTSGTTLTLQAQPSMAPVAPGGSVSFTVDAIGNPLVTTPTAQTVSLQLATTRDAVGISVNYPLYPTSVLGLNEWMDTHVAGQWLSAINITFTVPGGLQPGDAMEIVFPPSFGLDAASLNVPNTGLTFSQGDYRFTYTGSPVSPGQQFSASFSGKADMTPTTPAAGDYSVQVATLRDAAPASLLLHIAPVDLYVDNAMGEPSCNGQCIAVDMPGACVCGPFHDIDVALAVAQPGNVVHVASGTYTTSNGIGGAGGLPMAMGPGVTLTGSTSRASDTIISGYSASDFVGIVQVTNGDVLRNLTLQMLPNDSGNRVAIYCNGLVAVTLDGLVLDGGSAGPNAGVTRGLYAIQACAATVTNTTFKNFTADGAYLSATRDSSFTNVKFLNNNRGVSTSSWCTVAPLVDNAVFCGNTGSGIYQTQGAPTYNCCPIDIINSSFTDSDPDGCSTPNTEAIRVESCANPAYGVSVRGSTIERSSGYGVYAWKASVDLGQYADDGGNTVRDNGKVGICLVNGASDPFITVFAAGNTWQGGTTTSGSLGSDCEVAQSSVAGDVSLQASFAQGTVCTSASDSSCVAP